MKGEIVWINNFIKNMKKLSLFVIALVVMLVPTVFVQAAEAVECTQTHEAKIGDACYTTLSDALSAAQNNDTVVLEKDVESSNYVLVQKPLTIDFNGKTLKLTGGEANGLGLVIYSQVTLKNGKVVSEVAPTFGDGSSRDAFAVTLYSTANLTLTNMEVESLHRSAICFYDNHEQTLTIDEKSTVKSYTGAGVVAYQNGTYTLNVEGTIVNDGTWSAINGAYSSTGTLNVNVGKTGKVSSTEGSAILQMANGKITVEGTVTGYEAGVAMTKGELEVADSATISATGHGSVDSFTASSNGKVYANGAAIYVEPVDEVSVDVKGGTLTSTEGYVISAPSTSEDQNDKLTISVEDGNFESAKGSFEIVNYSGDGFVSGGTFLSAGEKDDIAEYIQTSEDLGQSESGTVGTVYKITINESKNGKVTTEYSDAVVGEEVTITTIADKGYELDKLVVTYGDDKTVKVTKGKFLMPEGNVTITATFKVTAKNPDTVDSIMTYVSLATVSTMAIVCAALYLKKKSYN